MRQTAIKNGGTFRMNINALPYTFALRQANDSFAQKTTTKAHSLAPLLNVRHVISRVRNPKRSNLGLLTESHRQQQRQRYCIIGKPPTSRAPREL
jgi:hypothetical protein